MYKEVITCLQMEDLRENYEHLLTGCEISVSPQKNKEERPERCQ